MKNCPLCHSKPKLGKSKRLLHPYARREEVSLSFNCNKCGFITSRFNHTIEQARNEWNEKVGIYLMDKEL